MVRDVYIDNIKGYLIIIVVLVHIIECMRDNFDIARQMYLFLSIFCMPAFIFISGYFSTKGKGKYAIKNDFIRIILPYMIFQVLFLLIIYLYHPTITTKELIKTVLMAPYSLWYLFCIFFWKTILPWFVKLPYPIILSIAIGLLSGFLPKYGQLLNISRMLAFFPFFVVGYYAQTEKWFPYQSANSHNIKYKAVSIAILLCALTCSVIIDGRFYTHFQYDQFYIETGQAVWFGFLLRLMAYSAAFLVGLSFMHIIPKTRSVISLIGERSLYVYLLHSLILYFFVQSQALSAIKHLYSFAGIILLGMLLTVLLSTDTIKRFTKPFVEPHTIWNLRNNST